MLNYEIRDPIHGFITINEWEKEIVNNPVFQRLRRVKQLAWTDMVYPGACHNRFEHSLGVMHVATKMFDKIVEKEEPFLKGELHYTNSGLERDRCLLRLACLLHDIGHSPFSHAGEGLMSINPNTDKQYKHEHYSAAIVRGLFKDVIENHSFNENYHITADEVAQFIEGSKPQFGRVLLWRELLSSQLDADRADYLLRDSHHCGVTYGHYDLNRLLVTLTIGISDSGSPIIAIEKGGLHVAESLILARYQMFTQVYFQHTRRAYDHHISDLLKILLEEEQNTIAEIIEKDKFSPPENIENLMRYISWDDWKVYGLLSSGRGGEVAAIVRQRRHYRSIYETKEIPLAGELDLIEGIGNKLDEAKIPGFLDNATSSWYKLGKEDIAVCTERQKSKETVPLSMLSSVVKSIAPIMQQRIYVPYERKSEAISIIEQIRRGNK